MSYSSDFRVLDFISNGGSKAEASRRFGISRTCIYEWLKAQDPLASAKPGPRGPRCLDYPALKQHVADFPDATQNERAAHFGVYGIWYGEKTQYHSKKKTMTYKELRWSARDAGVWQ